ncbi:SHOCT domain-containing protein [Anaeromicropila populeti]|uniref:SHOCT-like domain-containing protein n=1 Tax=Anaeromicropila populeti TaxID=37658 RepID=A0A1I6LVG7_9FIRM|nr:SHOCT domain-containing protein [Anaeromicropila populeti]SFS07380.1 hypothetical protein SAMN05661086_03591 [Anaeromicropila populeti]
MNVTRIDGNPGVLREAKKMTYEQLQNEYQYILVQKIVQNLLDHGLISIEECHKITEKNRQTFSPYLAELMP